MKTPNVCPIVSTRKEQLLAKYHELEVKAKVYSGIDWERYNEICAEMKDIDNKLLDIYSKETA